MEAVKSNAGALAVSAFSSASKRLRNKYPNDFQSFLEEERTARGLSPKPTKGVTEAKLVERIDAYQKKLEETRSKLDEIRGF